MKLYLYTKYIILAIIGGIVKLGKLLISFFAVCGLLFAVGGGPLPLIKFIFNPEIFSSTPYGDLFIINCLASIVLAMAGFLIKEASAEDLLTIRKKVEADLSKKTNKTEDAMVGSIEIVQTGGLSMYEKIEENVSRSMNQREKNKKVTRGY